MRDSGRGELFCFYWALGRLDVGFEIGIMIGQKGLYADARYTSIVD